MKKRRAKRKNPTEKGDSTITNAEERFANLIARMIVDITLEQAKEQNKGNEMDVFDIERDSKPDYGDNS
ncbi:hypothetical protein QFZ20_004081 [Flavobacterium sp. W4I14]|nr:hypothetical protein [Flavobacterium sp. W4I14]